jgi:predicted nucleic acid-binding protein
MADSPFTQIVRLRAKFPQIAQLDMARIISLFEQAQVVEPQDVPSVSCDPKDDKFLACARSAGTDYLVTERSSCALRR